MDSSGRDDSAGSGGSAAAELSLAADEGFSCSALLSACGWDAGLEAVWAGLEVSAGFEEGSAGLDDSAGLEGSGFLWNGGFRLGHLAGIAGSPGFLLFF